MTYLITGATGLIGRRLVEVLLQAGHNVNYLAPRRSSTLDSRASFHRWDRGSVPEFGGMPRLDAVIHLAGEPISQRWTEDVKQKIAKSRVEGTRHLVDGLWRLRYKPEVLVSSSAVGYYGDRGDELLDESAPRGAGFLADICADWEREALRAQAAGLRVVCIRTAVVLARSGGALQQMLLPFRLGIGGKFGSGRQWMPWIHLDDLVHLFEFAAEHTEVQGGEVQGALNGSAPEPLRNADFTRALGKALHRPTVMPVPEFALKIAMGELAGFLLASQRVVPKRTEETGFRFQFGEIENALRNLIAKG